MWGYPGAYHRFGTPSRPDLCKMWCPPKASAESVAHLEGVLGACHRPRDPRRLVVCADETFRQLVGEVREPVPAAPGRAGRYDGMYVCNGVSSLFRRSSRWPGSGTSRPPAAGSWRTGRTSSATWWTAGARVPTARSRRQGRPSDPPSAPACGQRARGRVPADARSGVSQKAKRVPGGTRRVGEYPGPGADPGPDY